MNSLKSIIDTANKEELKNLLDIFLKKRAVIDVINEIKKNSSNYSTEELINRITPILYTQFFKVAAEKGISFREVFGVGNNFSNSPIIKSLTSTLESINDVSKEILEKDYPLAIKKYKDKLLKHQKIIQGIKKAPPFIIGTKTVHINAYTNYNYINSLYDLYFTNYDSLDKAVAAEQKSYGNFLEQQRESKKNDAIILYEKESILDEPTREDYIKQFENEEEEKNYSDALFKNNEADQGMYRVQNLINLGHTVGGLLGNESTNKWDNDIVSSFVKNYLNINLENSMKRYIIDDTGKAFIKKIRACKTSEDKEKLIEEVPNLTVNGKSIENADIEFLKRNIESLDINIQKTNLGKFNGYLTMLINNFSSLRFNDLRADLLVNIQKVIQDSKEDLDALKKVYKETQGELQKHQYGKFEGIPELADMNKNLQMAQGGRTQDPKDQLIAINYKIDLAEKNNDIRSMEALKTERASIMRDAYPERARYDILHRDNAEISRTYALNNISRAISESNSYLDVINSDLINLKEVLKIDSNNVEYINRYNFEIHHTLIFAYATLVVFNFSYEEYILNSTEEERDSNNIQLIYEEYLQLKNRFKDYQQQYIELVHLMEKSKTYEDAPLSTFILKASIEDGVSDLQQIVCKKQQGITLKSDKKYAEVYSKCNTILSSYLIKLQSIYKDNLKNNSENKKVDTSTEEDTIDDEGLSDDILKFKPYKNFIDIKRMFDESPVEYAVKLFDASKQVIMGFSNEFSLDEGDIKELSSIVTELGKEIVKIIKVPQTANVKVYGDLLKDYKNNLIQGQGKYYKLILKSRIGYTERAETDAAAQQQYQEYQINDFKDFKARKDKEKEELQQSTMQNNYFDPDKLDIENINMEDISSQEKNFDLNAINENNVQEETPQEDIEKEENQEEIEGTDKISQIKNIEKLLRYARFIYSAEAEDKEVPEQDINEEDMIGLSTNNFNIDNLSEAVDTSKEEGPEDKPKGSPFEFKDKRNKQPKKMSINITDADREEYKKYFDQFGSDILNSDEKRILFDNIDKIINYDAEKTTDNTMLGTKEIEAEIQDLADRLLNEIEDLLAQDNYKTVTEAIDVFKSLGKDYEAILNDILNFVTPEKIEQAEEHYTSVINNRSSNDNATIEASVYNFMKYAIENKNSLLDDITSANNTFYSTINDIPFMSEDQKKLKNNINSYFKLYDDFSTNMNIANTEKMIQVLEDILSRSDLLSQEKDSDILERGISRLLKKLNNLKKSFKNVKKVSDSDSNSFAELLTFFLKKKNNAGSVFNKFNSLLRKDLKDPQNINTYPKLYLYNVMFGVESKIDVSLQEKVYETKGTKAIRKNSKDFEAITHDGKSNFMWAKSFSNELFNFSKELSALQTNIITKLKPNKIYENPERISPSMVTLQTTGLGKNEVYVFGSDIEKQRENYPGKLWGASKDKINGLSGNTYAIPLYKYEKQYGNKPLFHPLKIDFIKKYIEEFIASATQHPDLNYIVMDLSKFQATKLYDVDEVAALFEKAYNLPNVYLPEAYRDLYGTSEPEVEG